MLSTDHLLVLMTDPVQHIVYNQQRRPYLVIVGRISKTDGINVIYITAEKTAPHLS